MAKDKSDVIASLYTAFAYESLTISDTTKVLTASKYTFADAEDKVSYAKRAIIVVENAQLRYLYDGVNTPTATEGLLRNPMDVIILTGATNIRNFNTIRKGTTDAKIFVVYER